jgi:hypothetical protein
LAAVPTTIRGRPDATTPSPSTGRCTMERFSTSYTSACKAVRSCTLGEAGPTTTALVRSIVATAWAAVWEVCAA